MTTKTLTGLFLSVWLGSACANAQPFRVEDAVSLTSPGSDVPFCPAPDGRRQLILTRRGDLRSNTNRYTLYWLDQRLKPEPLVELASSSNRPAIEQVRWLSDNDTVCFLGEQPGQSHQLYAIRCSQGKLFKLADHPRNLLAYALTPDLRRLAYVAMPPQQPLFQDRSGLVVSNQSLLSLLTDPPAGGDYSERYELMVQNSPGTVCQVSIPDNPWVGRGGPLTLSPDGRFLALTAMMRDIPASWANYQDAYMQSQVSSQRPAGAVTNLWRWYLVDLESARARPLLDAPGYGAGNAVWSEDGRSLLVSRCYAPLTGITAEERALRQSKPYTLEVDVATGSALRVGEASWEPLSWNGPRAIFQTQAGRTALVKTGQDWKPAGPDPNPTPSGLTLQLEEDMNTPPRIYTGSSGRKTLVLDLNPELKGLAEVRELEWKGSDGVRDRGGLYMPKGAPGQRYPLVIQTHDWDKNRFLPEGSTHSGYAAQALANLGFMVAQVEDNISRDVLTPREGPRTMASYEGLIDHLDSQGLLDRSKVALVGWSRSSYYVKYTLAHSRYPLAAAMVCDGFDAGDFQYMTYPDGESEALNGGVPWGSSLASWLANAPGFQIARVNTPLLIQAPNRESVLGEWEWFSALRRLRRPVEMLVLESGSHDLVRPRDRQIAQQATVDWMRFWLQGHEEPGRPEQNARWRALRELEPLTP